MNLGSLEVFEKSRIDRQRSHIVHNPIFALGLRFRVKFQTDCSLRSPGDGSRGTGRPGLEGGADILLFIIVMPGMSKSDSSVS